MNQAQLLRRIRCVLAVFIIGLAVSGLTAIPIASEFKLMRSWLGDDFRAGGRLPEAVSAWLATADRGINATEAQAPFVYYGTDWLAFGHVVIALAFVGAWQDPVRNQWLFPLGAGVWRRERNSSLVAGD
jgi:hypothetical protein